jgi:hypothetical protein
MEPTVAEVNVEGTGLDPERSPSRGFLSRLTRLVKTVAAPLLTPSSPIPRRAQISGPEHSAQTLQSGDGVAGKKEVRQPPEQAAAHGLDPPAPQKRSFEETEAYQADLRAELSKSLKSFGNQPSKKISVESLRNTQADGEAVFGSTASRRSQSENTKLSKGAVLHPRAPNLKTTDVRKGPFSRHPNREGQIPSVPQLPDGSLSPIPKGASSSTLESKNSEARGINPAGTTSGQENTQDPHIRPAYRDGLGEETATRPKLNPRSRSYSR